RDTAAARPRTDVFPRVELRSPRGARSPGTSCGARPCNGTLPRGGSRSGAALAAASLDSIGSRIGPRGSRLALSIRTPEGPPHDTAATEVFPISRTAAIGTRIARKLAQRHAPEAARLLIPSTDCTAAATRPGALSGIQ